MVLVPPSSRDRVKGGSKAEDCGMWGRGGQFLSVTEAYIPNLSLLMCLEAFKKFLVGGGGWWWWVVESKFSVQLRLKLNNKNNIYTVGF